MTNGTMMQYFHWYTPADGRFWNSTKDNAEKLAELGIDAVWLPPAYKGKGGGYSNGYDAYDLYDLGEFDQKGSVRTKFGTREEYLQLIEAFHAHKIRVYADIVLNHKGGGDELERIEVRRVDPDNRNVFTSDPFFIEAYTKFTFPCRKQKYSSFIWDHHCFTGVDYAGDLNEDGIFFILNQYGDGWEELIDTEKGNYDFLMLCDIEFRNPAVREELKKWGKWYLKTTNLDGVRLDALKHITPGFFTEWLDFMRTLKPDLFAVGEYWAPGDLPLLLKYIEATEDRMSLFDATLHQSLHLASRAGKDFDLRTILAGSLVKEKPDLAVTIVDNHDTQPLQALESPVEAWFKPLAYALILLRDGGYPCVFYPDLYGAHYSDKGKDGQDQEIFLNKCEHIEGLLFSRKLFAYGRQRDYFDHANCIGWTREGIDEQPGSGCAVVLSNNRERISINGVGISINEEGISINGEGIPHIGEGFKSMEIGRRHAGKIFVDYLGKHQREVIINEEGLGEFPISEGGVSVWVAKRQ